MRSARYVLAAAGFAIVAMAASPAVAAGGGVHIATAINSSAVSEASTSHPVRLVPREPASIAMAITNNGNAPVTIGRVQLSGRVLGLSFFDFSTSVSLLIPPGATRSLTYQLDLTGLGGQATGLIPGQVKVLDSTGHTVATQSTVIDVRGSLWSVYGGFGIALIILTVLALLDVILGIARHRMPANRWRRALRFVVPGIGIGMVLTFTLSAVRVWVASPVHWWPIMLIGAAVFFVVGYLTPAGVDADDEHDDLDFFAPAETASGPDSETTVVTGPTAAARETSPDPPSLPTAVTKPKPLTPNQRKPSKRTTSPEAPTENLGAAAPPPPPPVVK